MKNSHVLHTSRIVTSPKLTDLRVCHRLFPYRPQYVAHVTDKAPEHKISGARTSSRCCVVFYRKVTKTWNTELSIYPTERVSPPIPRWHPIPVPFYKLTQKKTIEIDHVRTSYVRTSSFFCLSVRCWSLSNSIFRLITQIRKVCWA